MYLKADLAPLHWQTVREGELWKSGHDILGAIYEQYSS